MNHLWAPWRLSYIQDNNAKVREGCFFCHAWQELGLEQENLLLYRGQESLVMLNRFPYGSGHLLIAPSRHIGSIEDANSSEGQEIWSLISKCKVILGEALGANGFNIGINQGAVAGAGVLDHLHIHIVPRWQGDNNFMSTISNTRVLPQALDAAFVQLKPYFAE